MDLLIHENTVNDCLAKKSLTLKRVRVLLLMTHFRRGR